MFSNKRVLTVDDSPTIRTFLHGLLSLHGAQVEEAGSGREALEMLAKGKYDLVLLDLLLPDVDGIQVLRGLRERDGETAVVMLTGMGGIKSATTAVSRGADGYIEKQDLSFGGDFTEFFYALEQALEHRAGLVAQKQLQEVKADFYSMVTHDLRMCKYVDRVIQMMDGRISRVITDVREISRLAGAADELGQQLGVGGAELVGVFAVVGLAIALAAALISYSGTLIFTSHDRHFMHRVATNVIEVRAGRVASYPGSYDEYVYRIQSEIDSGLRAPPPDRRTWWMSPRPASAISVKLSRRPKATPSITARARWRLS